MEEITLDALDKVIGGAVQPNQQGPRSTGAGNTGSSMWGASTGGGVRQPNGTMQFVRDPVGAAKGPNGASPRM
jgi:hypothetical protein